MWQLVQSPATPLTCGKTKGPRTSEWQETQPGSPARVSFTACLDERPCGSWQDTHESAPAFSLCAYGSVRKEDAASWWQVAHSWVGSDTSRFACFGLDLWTEWQERQLTASDDA